MTTILGILGGLVLAVDAAVAWFVGRYFSGKGRQ